MRLCLWNCCTSEHVLKYKEFRKYKKCSNGSCIGFEIMLYFHEIKMFNWKKKKRKHGRHSIALCCWGFMLKLREKQWPFENSPSHAAATSDGDTLPEVDKLRRVLMTSQQPSPLLAVGAGASARRYFEISAAKRLLCHRALPCSLPDGENPTVCLLFFYHYYLWGAKERIRMSFSRAPLKRFNDTFGKTSCKMKPGAISQQRNWNKSHFN